jgi:hypothetical protein
MVIREWFCGDRHRSRPGLAAAFGLACTIGCSRDPTLDEAIREWLEIRAEASREKCVCYQLFIDLRDPEHGPYATEEDCLAAVPEVTDTAVDCIVAVLESGLYKTPKNIEIMQCYQSVAQELRICEAEKLADDCSSPSNCNNLTLQTYDDCAGQLSDGQMEAIFLCRTE